MAPPLTVTFDNTSGYHDKDVWIGFAAGTNALTVSAVNGGTAILSANAAQGAGNWYSLKTLGTGGVSITSFSGRIYVCYGTPWSPQYPGYEPAQAVTDANLFLRYDKMEITYTGQPADVANLTSIDYWSIPMTLTTLQAGSQQATVQGLVGSTTTQDLFEALNGLTTTPAANGGPGGTDGSPMPALVPGQFQQYGSGPQPGTDFARVISPSSYPPLFPTPTATIPVTPYPTFAAYLTYLGTTFGPGTMSGAVVASLGAGTIAQITGNFAGLGTGSQGATSAQAYALTATIDASNDITLTGTLTPASGSGGATSVTMLFKAADLLNSSGIYGGNAPFYLNGSTTATAPQNDVYGWISADLFAGLNIGAVGSTTQVGGTAVGAIPSQQWFSTLTPSQFFANLQSSPSYYNQWAATLQPCSDAYNFAYSDRFAAVLVSLNPADVDTLQITLLPGKVNMTPVPAEEKPGAAAAPVPT